MTVGRYPCDDTRCNKAGYCLHIVFDTPHRHPRCNQCGGEVAILDHSKGHKEDCKTKAALF